MKECVICKTCRKCNETKPISEFHNNKANKDGKTFRCKVCRIEAAKKWNAENWDRYRENTKRWVKDNPDRPLIYRKKRKKKQAEYDRLKHKKQFAIKQKENPELYFLKCQADDCCNFFYSKSGGSQAKYCGEGVKDYCFMENQRRQYREKYHNSVMLKLSTIFRSKINALIRERRFSTPKVMRKLEYTWEELKQHIESQFTNGMSWENYGRNGWHIDHIRPVNSFEDTIEDFQKCWALNNLQPLWEVDNIRKSDKWDGKVNA